MSFPSVYRARRPAAAWALSLLPMSWIPNAAQAQPVPPERIVVTANRVPQPVSSVLGDLSVVDRQQIERSGAADLADLLARLPGVAMARNGGPGGTTSVYVRGGEARHVAVYIDGVRVDSQATGGAIWEQIPLDQIERIEVLRGPAAAVYGSDAVAGVVQLFTRRGQGPLLPTAALTLGQHNTRQAQLGLSGTVGGVDLAVSASHGRSDGVDARTADVVGHNTDRDGWTRSSVQGRVGLQLGPQHRLDASLLASRLKAGFDGFAPGADDENRHALRSGSLSWQGRWSADSSTRLQFGQTRSELEIQPSFYRTETTLKDATLQHEQRLGAAVLSVTLERREDELFNPATAFGAAFGGQRHQDGVGLGWRSAWGSQGLEAHLRHDDDSEFGSKGTGSLAWGWSWTTGWRVTASAGTSFRVPTLYQRFSEYGNAGLVPESGRHHELALRWTEAAHELSLTAWRNRVRNLISFGPPGPCVDSFGCYVNVGRAALEGVTLAGRMRTAGWSFGGSLDWHDPRNADTGRVLPRRARTFGTLSAETRWLGWTWGSELQVSGGRYEDAANTQRLGGYGLLNLMASTPVAPQLSLEARIDNVGDKAHELARGYRVLGRHAQLTLRWALN